MKYPAIIFDLDGTLLNTIDDLCDAVNYALRTNGYPERTVEEVKGFVGRGIRYMLSCAVPGGENNPHFGDVFNTFLPYYEAHCHDKTAPYPGIRAALQTLRDAGCQLAVVTNKVQSAAEELIASMFPEISIVVGDSPAVKRKPAPDGVFLALDRMGVTPADAAYVGDSDIDFATARNAGLPCLSVLWGFRTRAQLLACGADTFFSSVTELLSYILA